jgi:site-specific DNA recombinase
MAKQDLVGQRIAIYARFSSEGQRDASIDDQVRRCRAFADENGARVPDDLVFSDRATSGAGTDRPGFERLMRLVTDRPARVDVILVEDLSRLSRAQADLFTVQRLLEFAEVRLIGIADGIDTSCSRKEPSRRLEGLDDSRDASQRELHRQVALPGIAMAQGSGHESARSGSPF